MRRQNNSGSMSPLVIVLIALAVIIVIGGVVLLLSGGGEETDNDSAVVAGEEAVDDGTAPADDADGAVAGSTNPQETQSSGDYTITNASELSPVCASGSFPSGVTSTPSGKKTVPFIQREPGESYEYFGRLASLGSDLSPGYSTNEVDLVACISLTETEVFRVSCTVSGTTFGLVGYELDIVVYNLQSEQEVGSSKLSHSMECPIFATLVDGKTRAISIDAESLETYINSL